MDQAQSPAGPNVPDPAGGPLERATLMGTLAHLWPYIWPGDRFDLKMRVVWSMVLLLAAKLITLTVPFSFKWATDALTGAFRKLVIDHRPVWSASGIDALRADGSIFSAGSMSLLEWEEGLCDAMA